MNDVQGGDVHRYFVHLFSHSPTMCPSKRYVDWKNYHLVNKSELKRTHKTTQMRLACAKEVILRSKFTNRYFGGAYDRGHRHWMKRLQQEVTTEALLDMPLSDIVAYRRAQLHSV